MVTSAGPAPGRGSTKLHFRPNQSIPKTVSPVLFALSIAAMMVSWFVWRRTEALAAKIATLVFYLVALIIFVKMPNPPNIGNWMYPLVLVIIGLSFWFDPRRKR
jgi:hypothetical protein